MKMSEIILTEREAKTLIKMNKVLTKPQVEWPPMGGAVEILLKSQHGQEDFILNYRRGPDQGGYHEKY